MKGSIEDVYAAYEEMKKALVMAGFMCDIVTPVAKLVSDEVELVVVPGVEGEMGFLKGHAPLVSVLADGEARAEGGRRLRDRALRFAGGYVG